MKRTFGLMMVLALLVALVVCVGSVGAAGDKERFKWAVTDKLTVLGGGATFNSTVTMGSSDLDLDGNSLILDSDADSSLTADTDDQLDLELGGADEYVFTASIFDVNANKIDLDADADTSVTADTDDQIDFELGGADIVVINEWGASDITTDTTEYLVEILDSTPVMTGGTNSLAALNIDMGIGNSTGGTNTIYGILVDGIVQDAQNTETAVYITNGWDRGIEMDGNSLYMDNDNDSYFSELADDSIGFTPGAATGSLEVRTGNLQVGDGTPDETHNGEDFYVEGISEVDGSAYFDGAVDMDSTINVAGAATMGNDVTISAMTDGGNKGTKNELSGLPRLKLVAMAQGTNPGGETVDCMDATPTGEWTEVDAGTNLTVTADTDYYRHDTNSIKLEVTTVAENDGVSVALPAQDDLSGLESVGFWIYSDEAISSGDLDLTVDDSNGTDQVYSIGAVTADIWTWVEVDISGCDANCDTTDNFIILFTAQGAGALSDPAIYIDELFYWDSVDEDALSTAILRDGVLSIVDAESGATLAEYTDYIVHEESGNDYVVWITDQSAADVVALVAY